LTFSLALPSCQDEANIPSQKRRDQTRISQRVFRLRKEKHVYDLEAKVEEVKALLETANYENNMGRSTGTGAAVAAGTSGPSSTISGARSDFHIPCSRFYNPTYGSSGELVQDVPTSLCF
jgi:hypothetical protein